MLNLTDASLLADARVNNPSQMRGIKPLFACCENNNVLAMDAMSQHHSSNQITARCHTHIISHHGVALAASCLPVSDDVDVSGD